jgi:uncharacterized membrane protein YdfJ with MMPL/SSD domain
VPVLRALADHAVAHPRRVLVGALVFFLVAAGLGGPVAGLLSDSGAFEVPGSSSQRAVRSIERATGREAEPGIIALVRTPGGAGAAAGRAAAARVARTLRGDAGIAVVARRPAVSRDGRRVALFASLKAGAGEHGVVARLDARFARDPGVTLGGGAVVGRQVGDQANVDLGTAELLAFPLLAALSLLFFRGARAAALPLCAGLVTVLGTFLVLRAVNTAYSLSVFALNVVIGLGLGLAIDYSLFLLSRFREELAAGAEPDAAVRTTMTHTGRTVIFSALTVAAALSTLVLFPQRFVKSMGIGGAVVALVAAAAALGLTPALLVLWGRKLARAPREHAGRWEGIARIAMRRAGLVAILTTVAMVLVALPALRVEWGGVDASALSTSHSGRQVADALARDFPRDDSSPVTVVVHRASGPGVAAYARELAALPGALRASPPARLAPDLWRIDLAAPGTTTGPRAQRLVAAVHTLPAPGPVDVGGGAASFFDQRAAISARVPLALGVLVVATLVLLWLMTGSVLLPLKALVMNLLTLGVATGVLVLVFQDGRAEGLLAYTSQGSIEQSDFLVLVAVGFALSTDYGVFVLSRIKEEHDAGQNDREAVAHGIGRTGGLISAAALLLAVAIGAFATSQLIFLKEVGVGALVAVLVDAFVVRALLVPSLMALLGRANWWSPPALRRLHARVAPAPA